MARKGPLKVFRTPIGFHDAYVAATSRQAALAAWGADKDLFASGSAELVTDPALTERPLAAPGEVIKVARGSVGEHLRAAGRAPVRAKRAGHEAAPTPPRRTRAPRPRPSRSRVDEAEAAIQAFEVKAAAERAALDRREAALLRERKALNASHRRSSDQIEARLDRVRERYEQAMERWRAEE
jgi:hypothetical protein